MKAISLLTIPNTSADVLRNCVKIGTVHCINVAPTGAPVIKYYGRNLSGTASGHSHVTQARAELDVADWADGKEVAYVKHAVCRSHRYRRPASPSYYHFCS